MTSMAVSSGRMNSSIWRCQCLTATTSFFAKLQLAMSATDQSPLTLIDLLYAAYFFAVSHQDQSYLTGFIFLKNVGNQKLILAKERVFTQREQFYLLRICFRLKHQFATFTTKRDHGRPLVAANIGIKNLRIDFRNDPVGNEALNIKICDANSEKCRISIVSISQNDHAAPIVHESCKL